MNEWFGWVQGSGMPATYVHLSGRDMDSSYAKIHGIEEDVEPEISRLSPEKCPRCRVSVAPGTIYCYQCGMALSVDEALAIMKDEQELIHMTGELDDKAILKAVVAVYKQMKENPSLFQ